MCGFSTTSRLSSMRGIEDNGLRYEGDLLSLQNVDVELGLETCRVWAYEAFVCTVDDVASGIAIEPQ